MDTKQFFLNWTPIGHRGASGAFPENTLPAFEEHQAKQHPEEEESLEDVPTEKDTAEFLEWLKEKLESGELTPNEKDAGVFVAAEGVLISQKLVNEFAQESATVKNANNLMDQLQKSGFFLKTAQGSSIHQYTVGPLSEGDFRMALMVDSTVLYNLTTIPAFSDTIKLAAPVMGTAHTSALGGQGQSQGANQAKGQAPQAEAPKAPPPAGK